MPRKKAEKPQTVRSVLARSPEMNDVARKLAVIALADVNQEGLLSVRQREQLRRALALAGEGLAWDLTVANGTDPLRDVTKDVLALSKAGAKGMAAALVDELAMKEGEMEQISEVSESAREMSENAETPYPLDISYHYTVRDVMQGLATKIETITANDAKEMLSAADSIARSLPSRGKLANLMIVALEKKQLQIEVTKKTLPDFTKSLRQLLEEVLANIH
jgi:hypothetical protein